MKTKIYSLLTLLFLSASVMAQSYQVSGKVTDADNQPLPGVSVSVKDGVGGTSTDFDGLYSIEVNNGEILVFTSVGFDTKKVTMDGSSTVNMVLISGVSLDEVVVTGNRAKPRTILDSPVPIDNIGIEELKNTGKVQVEQMLAYTVPSFNSANQAISDATAHFDPADLRGLGPSRTLVLMNGKRMKQSAQIYLNGTPGKGEVGIDLKSFPNSAVKRIEVLRDGASAQYGSDAIAGVINIILKDDTDISEINSHVGVTSEGDGFNMGIDYNSTFQLGEGRVNLSFEYMDQKLTNRAGEPGLRDLPAAPVPGDFDNSEDYDREVIYHQNITDWATENPNIGMIVGQPDLTKNSAMVNLTYPIGENAEFYTFHTFTKREGRSFAYYRAPYWRSDVQAAEFLTEYVDHVGYHPTFETKVLDNMNSLGFKFELAGFQTDLSATYGRNYVDYTVNRSVNRDYLADHGTSPRTFHPGGYAFSNFVTNLDFSRVFNDMISTSFGFEYKKEYYKGHKGDEVSFYKGGSDSFAGIKEAEAMDVDRSNFAAYLGVDFDITENFLIGGAVRYEDFSDFGSNVSWKVNSRFKIGDNAAIRASVSTGFRAPSLHQRYIQLTQYIIVAPNPDPQLQGTLPNDSDAVKGLGVPSLTAETSLNFSIGATAKLGKLNLSADIYRIAVDDRVLFSSQIKPLDGNLDGSDPVEQILIDNDVLALQFFINAVNTTTTGLDLVLNYNNVEIGNGYFGANLAMNFNNTELDGAVANPPILEAGGYEIFNHREELRITDSRPKSKILLGLNYEVNDFNFAFNNTRFGEVTVPGETAVDDQLHDAKIVTDLMLSYDFSEAFSMRVSANNIFDVYPDVLHDGTNGNADLRSAGGRFLYSSEVTQMGQLGTNFLLSFALKF